MWDYDKGYYVIYVVRRDGVYQTEFRRREEAEEFVDEMRKKENNKFVEYWICEEREV